MIANITSSVHTGMDLVFPVHIKFIHRILGDSSQMLIKPNIFGGQKFMKTDTTHFSQAGLRARLIDSKSRTLQTPSRDLKDLLPTKQKRNLMILI